jgi:hypothetical protein
MTTTQTTNGQPAPHPKEEPSACTELASDRVETVVRGDVDLALATDEARSSSRLTTRALRRMLATSVGLVRHRGAGQLIESRSSPYHWHRGAARRHGQKAPDRAPRDDAVQKPLDRGVDVSRSHRLDRLSEHVKHGTLNRAHPQPRQNVRSRLYRCL